MELLLNHKTLKNLVITLIAILVLFTAVKTISEYKSMKYIGTGINPTNTITVSGTADVMATPNIATFSFTVQNEAPAVPDAQKKSTDAMNAILAYIKQQGIDDKDVQTDSYNIYPRYDYVGGGAYIPGKQVLAAYVVSQTVEVKVRDLSKAGTLLSGVGQYGATNISGLTFSIDQQTMVERQARDKAIADAKNQAQSLASSLGVSLVRIISFNEAGNYPQPIYYAKAMSAGAVTMDAAAAPSIPTGQNKITSNVTITYEIK